MDKLSRNIGNCQSLLRNIQEERNSLTPRRKPEITHSLSLVLSQKRLNEIQNLRNKDQQDALFTIRKHIPMHDPENVREIQNLTSFFSNLHFNIIQPYIYIYVYCIYVYSIWQNNN
jgi:hypothetical protein